MFTGTGDDTVDRGDGYVEPVGDITLETIADRAIAIGVEQGWDVREKAARGIGWCASKPRRDSADGFVTLEIQIRARLAVLDNNDHVSVRLLLLGRACSTE